MVISKDYRVVRPFMKRGDSEPNIRYRPWLEKNIGTQYVDWNWVIFSDDTSDYLKLIFKNHKDAVLFELTWP